MSTTERLVASAAVVLVGGLLAFGFGEIVRRRVDDPSARYHLRKLTRYGLAIIALIALGVVWRAFAGRVGVVLGVAAAGIAFAMQEVIGALAGWANILTGRIFRVGDRIEMAGVRGDVIDVTPLRTKVIEIGSVSDNDSWVRGWQPTGRVVSISNKKTFTEPVFNFSANLDFLWQELTLPVAYEDDWRRAEEILDEETAKHSDSAAARAAVERMARNYPVARLDLEPRVFVRATDNFVELTTRFVAEVRSARATRDELTRTVLARFESEGIAVASETQEVTVRSGDDDGEAS